MSDLALPQRLGRRMTHILVDRSIFAWVHRIAGTVAGCTCVFSAIITQTIIPHVWPSGTWQRGFSALTAFFFAVAAAPFAVSYSFNIDRVGESLSRTAIFGVIMALSSIGVDACTFGIFHGDHALIMLAVLYFVQAGAYVLLGHILLQSEVRVNPADPSLL
jgi:hypothetical protein